MADGINRYLDLIDSTLREARKTRHTRFDSLAVALDFVDHVLGLSGPTSRSDDSSDLIRKRVTDGAGHSRPLYRGLALYALNRIGRVSKADLNELQSLVAPEADWFLNSPRPPRAAEGARLVQLAFDALALSASFESPHAANVIEQIAARQQPDGRLLEKTASDNPEPMWYHELALLHVVATHAHASGSDLARAATLRAAQYGSEQIQPDHASSHPFALHAFLRVPEGVFLTDMMLHAAGVQSPSTMDTVSLLLLADALDCMRRRKWRE